MVHISNMFRIPFDHHIYCIIQFINYGIKSTLLFVKIIGPSLVRRYKTNITFCRTLKCERTQTRATLHKDPDIDTNLILVSEARKKYFWSFEVRQRFLVFWNSVHIFPKTLCLPWKHVFVVTTDKLTKICF